MVSREIKPTASVRSIPGLITLPQKNYRVLAYLFILCDSQTKVFYSHTNN